ncbi:arginine decarboxylase [Selaginella moellendorffii]|nr:arginine decarboxylase [Selaginella moellendorffii]|eukprot:XP_002983909.2 arginine decarboxylase [Selaginella moellendorffii]
MRSLAIPPMTIGSGSSSGSDDDEEVLFRDIGPGRVQEDLAKQWSAGDSMALYRIGGWGFPFYSINGDGNLCVNPSGSGSGGASIELRAVIDRVLAASSGNISPPLIIRFPELLGARLRELQSAFQGAIHALGYNNRFQGVFPVKCNPDKLLVEEIVAAGKPFAFGLEAGSKPELLLTMSAMCKAHPDAFLICNGYKDAEYVQLALLARSLGMDCIIVLEQLDEVDLVIEMSQRLGIEPAIGVRSKLHTKHGGHWGETCGEGGKFGLSAPEIVEVARRLRRQGMLDCLELVHFHVGSQIPCLSVVKDSVSEAAFLYCELALMGAGMRILDIGGGLGIDYDGSASASSDMSVGYTVPEYASAVVAAIDAACTMKKVDAPVVCCESGRGLVSHHSVLVFDVYSATRVPKAKSSEQEELLGMVQELEFCEWGELDLPLGQLCEMVRAKSYGVAAEYARNARSEASRLFKSGLVSLELRAGLERLYELLVASSMRQAPATYHMNLSMFKAIPDNWALGQLFPIVPLQRLNEEPTVRAILSDLTCDSDGRITSFVCGGGGGGGDTERPSPSLPVHELEEDDGVRAGGRARPYYLGLFLGGAYQEALSSMHNLFGVMHVVHVASDGGGGFSVTREIPGQSIASVLRSAQHDPGGMFDSLRARVIGSLAAGRFHGEREARVALQILAKTFSSYTYLHTIASTTTTTTSDVVE